MDQDVNKFVLVAYEKGNYSNRTEILKKHLSTIDMYTSQSTYSDFYDKLLKNNSIKKEQKEFVIWYKEKKLIKQLPVIFNDSDIKLYSSYLYLVENEENDFYKNLKKQKGEEEYNKAKKKTEEFYKKLNEETYKRFCKKVSDDSKKYNELDTVEQILFLKGNDFSALFTRMPYAKLNIKNSVKDYIIGVCRDSSGVRVKGDKNHANCLGNIRTDIEKSYRCFRDAYLLLKNNNNYETTNMDLDYDSIYKTNIEQLEVEQQIDDNNKKSYNFNDLDRLFSYGTYTEKMDFSDFVDKQKLPKYIKQNIYWACLCDSFQNSDINNYIAKIRDYEKKHPDYINKLLQDYYSFKEEIIKNNICK